MIEELTREKEAQRSQIKDLKLNLELQESQHEKKDTEYARSLSKKEKEIEDLHSLLSKSYHSASSSLAKAQLASRLESETKELAKKVKEGSAMRPYRDPRAPSAALVRNSEEVSKASEDYRASRSPLSTSQLAATPPTGDANKPK